jgi:hypothetical protein
LDVTDPALDLDHEKAPRAGIPREQVAAATIAVVVEAHLCPRDPARSLEAGGCGVLQGGVRAIDEPIDVSSAPSDFYHQRCVECSCEPRKGAKGQSIQLAPLGA